MKEVTKDEFYKIIDESKLDLCVNVLVNKPFYPCTTEFNYRNGKHWGKVVEQEENGVKYPLVKRYYIY